MADNNNNSSSNNAAGDSGAGFSQPAAADPVQPTTAYGQQPSAYAQYPSAYGQQYQNYQQYGYQNGGYYAAPYQQAAYPQSAPQSAPQVAETKFWINAKMALHGVSVVASIITLGMGLSLINGGPDVSFLAAIACPVPVMALIWSAAELIVRAVHKFQTGIHPGGQVAATLIIWLAAIIVGPLEALYNVTTDGYCDYEYNSDTSSYDVTEDCYDPWKGRQGLWIAITTFTCLLWVVMFSLFVMACIDTSRRNAAKRVVMVMNPASYWGPQAQGWQQMPQQNSQYVAVPQAAARGDADIPLQHRQQASPSPGTPYATPMENPINEKGKEPEVGAPHGVQEFYGGSR